MQFVGPDPIKQLDLELRNDKHALDLEHFEIRDQSELKNLVAKQSYGKWYMPPEKWEHVLH